MLGGPGLIQEALKRSFTPSLRQTSNSSYSQGFNLPRIVPFDGSLRRTDATNAILIKLDNTNYIFIEDPDDGYRSFMCPIAITDRTPKYILPDIEVTIEHITEPIPEEYNYYNNDIYEFYEGNNLILRVGTENVDDYYPRCLLEYYPEALKCNQNVVENNDTTNLDTNPTITVFDLISKLTKLPYDAPLCIRANPKGNYCSFTLKNLDVTFYDGEVTIEGDEV